VNDRGRESIGHDAPGRRFRENILFEGEGVAGGTKKVAGEKARASARKEPRRECTKRVT